MKFTESRILSLSFVHTLEAETFHYVAPDPSRSLGATIRLRFFALFCFDKIAIERGILLQNWAKPRKKIEAE